jgi:hypothetical protein
MVRGRRWSLLAALVSSLAITAGLSACGGSGTSGNAANVSTHTRTHAPATATTSAPTTTGAMTVTLPASANTTSTTSTATTSATGSGSGSGGAGLSGQTTTTTTSKTTTTTSSSCTGQDCQNGSPTVAGSVPPVNGKCRSGYVYVAAQDGGPALCIPLQTSTTANTATQ